MRSGVNSNLQFGRGFGAFMRRSSADWVAGDEIKRNPIRDGTAVLRVSCLAETGAALHDAVA
jgi:hypothetical protein